MGLLVYYSINVFIFILIFNASITPKLSKLLLIKITILMRDIIARGMFQYIREVAIQLCYTMFHVSIRFSHISFRSINEDKKLAIITPHISQLKPQKYRNPSLCFRFAISVYQTGVGLPRPRQTARLYLFGAIKADGRICPHITTYIQGIFREQIDRNSRSRP